LTGYLHRKQTYDVILSSLAEKSILLACQMKINSVLSKPQ